jgi:AraC-like DNA-binding protein
VEQPLYPTNDDQSSHWSETIGDAFGAIPRAIGQNAAVGAMSVTAFGPLSVFWLRATPQIIRRTVQTVRRQPCDPYKISIVLDGAGIMIQNDHQVSVGPGQMVMYETGRPFEWALSQPWSCAAITFAPDALSLTHSVLQGALHRVYMTQSGPGAVLADFIASALRQGTSTGAAAGQIGGAGLHLIAAVLGTDLPEDDAAADAKRAEVLHYVRRNLADSDLTHGRVAAAHQMAPRTLHRLFEHEPYTITEYIRLRRLEAARRDLADPLLQHLSIAEVAASWCFFTPAHFTRAFQAQYGVTP